MKSFKNHLIIWVSVSISLWLILTPTILVAGARVHSSSKDSAFVEQAIVPPSAPSSCTYIGVGKGGDHRPCPPSTHQ
ncbi:hypothetical protein PVL29_017376 [Vitis rotundifolia]|uniref:Uncharacterized protein n=1 Tax=Vitis rotundifolia TaxID=103349 RepID=A0AA38ZB31_VITRO|nr:hypothetical protein PVL29_017376 [Vitis rotundifolia]